MTRQPDHQSGDVTKSYGGITALENATFELFYSRRNSRACRRERRCKIDACANLDCGCDPRRATGFCDHGEIVKILGAERREQARHYQVYQETSLVAAANGGAEPWCGPGEQTFNIGAEGAQRRKTGSASGFNFKVDPVTTGGPSLSTAKRQMVEIARAGLNQARVIILDEPTAALTRRKQIICFDLMKTLAGGTASR